MNDSGRVAVTRQSSWRSEPAAALRGLANGSCPCRSMSWFMAAKCSRLQQHLAADLDSGGGALL